MKMESIPVEAWKWLEQDWIYSGRKQVPELFPVTETNDHMVFWQVLAGRVRIRHRARWTEVPAGRAVLLMPGTFTRRFSEDNRIISLRLRWQWPTGQPLFPDAPPLVLDHNHVRALQQPVNALLEWANQTERHAAGLPFSWQHFRVLPYQCDARGWFALQEILACLQTRILDLLLVHKYPGNLFQVTDERILDALTRILRHPVSQPLKVEELASAVGLSRSRFTALFQSQTGNTPAAVYRQRKRQQIRQLLQFTDRPIKQIAYENGFATLPLFSDWCRRSFAASPTEVRRMVRR